MLQVPEIRAPRNARVGGGTLARAAAVLAGGTATFAYRYLSFDQFPGDHFVHLSRSQQMLMGAWPVRDFVETGLPLMAASSALAQVVFTPGLHAEVIFIAAMYGLSAALLVWAIASISGSVAVGLVASSVTVLAHPVGYSYPKLLCYAAAFAMLRAYVMQPNTTRLLGLSATITAAFLMRHDHGVILGSTTLAALGVFHYATRQQLRRPLLFVVGTAALTVPYVLWVQAHVGIAQYVRDGVAFSRREAEKANWQPPRFALDRAQPLIRTVRLGSPERVPTINVRWSPAVSEPLRQEHEAKHRLKPIQPVGPRTWQYELKTWSSDDLRGLVSDPAVEDTHGIERRRFELTETPPRKWIGPVTVMAPGPGLMPRENAVTMLFYAVWLLPLFAAVLVASRWRATDPWLRALLAFAILVQIGMNVTMLRDPLDLRVKDVLVPTGVLLGCVLGPLTPTRARRLSKWSYQTVAYMFVIATVAGAALASPIDRQLATAGVSHGVSGMIKRAIDLQQEFAPPHERAGRQDQAPLVQYLATCTPPSSRILTLAFAPHLFFYTGRGFAAGQVALMTGFFATERDDALMLQRLQQEDVPFVVIDRDIQDLVQFSWPKLVAHIRENYRQAFLVQDGQTIIVLAETSRKPTYTFGAQRSPCFSERGAP